MLLISPERLNSAGFRSRVLPGLAPRIGLLVVDEAHCVSDWGTDFRPDYRRIRDVLAGLPDGTPVLATTATANDRVSADVAAQLGTDTVTLRGSLDRESLALSVIDTPDLPSAYAWIADALDGGRCTGSGLIYTLTVAETTRLAVVPRRARPRGRRVLLGHPARRARADREAAARARAAGGRRDLAASAWASTTRRSGSWSTSARRRRRSPTTSRSAAPGRALESAARGAAADRRRRAHLGLLRLDRLPDRGPRASGARRPRRRPGAARRGSRPTPACAAPGSRRCSRCSTSTARSNASTAAGRPPGASGPTTPPGTRRSPQPGGGSSGPCCATSASDACLMRQLRAELDDPVEADCGRCAVCTGTVPLAAPSPETVRAAVAHLRAQTDVVEPRKMWPAGAPRRGRIAEAARAEPGRALALAEDPAWADLVSAALQADQPVGEELFDGLVDGAVEVGLAGRPAVLGHLGTVPRARRDARRSRRTAGRPRPDVGGDTVARRRTRTAARREHQRRVGAPRAHAAVGR